MFKKNLKEGFLQRIATRIVDTYRGEVLKEKKRTFRLTFILLGGMATLGISSFLVSLFIENTIALKILSTSTLFFSLGNLPVIGALFIFYLEFKNKLKHGRFENFSAQSFVRYFRYTSFGEYKNLLILNKEEMNELFHMPLLSSQVSYFQDLILRENCLDYADVCDIPDAIAIQLEKKQKHLDNFFVENEIESPHSLLIHSSSPEVEKEETLASRL